MIQSWEFGKAAKTREGPVDLRSAKQVSIANRARRAAQIFFLERATIVQAQGSRFSLGNDIAEKRANCLARV